MNMLHTGGNQDPWGRFDTSSGIGSLLVSAMPNCAPDHVLELGSGSGVLVEAASQMWNCNTIVTVDIDSRIPALSGKWQNPTTQLKHIHHALDVYDSRLPEMLAKGMFDAALCNPPYVVPKWRSDFRTILKDAGLSSVYEAQNSVPADLIFLAQNMRLTREGGYIGIIVSDGLVSGEYYRNLRSRLILEHSVETVIELPRSAFRRADVQTYIVVIKHQAPHGQSVLLRRIGRNGHLSTGLEVSKEDAIHRMDYSHHMRKTTIKMMGEKDDYLDLQELAPCIARGSIESQDLHKYKGMVFHTTQFPSRDQVDSLRVPELYFGHTEIKDDDATIAREGDVLIARVGRNLHRKVCYVASGSAPISDTVYRLRLPLNLGRLVAEELVSPRGELALQLLARGSGARFLSKAALLTFPVNRKTVQNARLPW